MRDEAGLPAACVRCVLNSASTRLCKGFPLSLSLFAVLSLCAPSHVNVARDKAMYTAQKPLQGLSLKKGKKERLETEPGCVHFHFAYFLKCLPSANASYTQSAAACSKHKKGNRTINSLRQQFEMNC